MKVVMFLSNPYLPDPRVEKEARALVEVGNDVSIICWDRNGIMPSEETRDGISIRRVRTGKIKSKIGLVFHYPSFLFKCLKHGVEARPHIVHCHDFDTLPLGLLCSKLSGGKLVYDAHEHYAKMIEQDIPSPFSKLADIFERFLVKFPDEIIVANEMIAEYILRWTKKRVTVVMNCIELIPSDAARSRSSNDIVIFYGGSLEPLRYIEEIIDQMASVEGVIFKLAGSGSLKQYVQDASSNDPRIKYLGHLDRRDLLEEISKAHGVIAMLDPSNENNRIGTPNRMFEAMAYGTPVIAIKGTLSGKMVETERCGIVLDWDVNGLSRIVDGLSDEDSLKEMGRNGLNAAREKYNWTIMKKRLIGIYEDL